jgi:peptide/nickel transport system substrate-binding protein
MFQKLLIAVGIALVSVAAPAAAKDSVVIGMTLEPPGLDPTMGAAAAIGEITHYNVFEGLTKIEANNSVTPLLAESWQVTDDHKTFHFKIRQGVTFQNGVPLTSAQVKYSFERAASKDSTNKIKAFFENIETIDTPDPYTVVLTLKTANLDTLFQLGLSSAVIVEPQSAPTNATTPIGTGPFTLASWTRGSSVTLLKWNGYRAASSIALRMVTFKIINDDAAQVAALLAGDVDAFPRFGSVHNVAQFQHDPRFSVSIGGTEGKTILAINNKRKPLDDLRVRRALAFAVDRQAIIDGAMNGFGRPIGSHMVPNDPGYIDLTGMYAFNPDRARALLKEAGITTPLKLSLQLPPAPYALHSGEIIAAELANVGIEVRIENVEWAQWLSGIYKNKNFDLTIIAHVEPLDLSIYADPNYYFNYDSAAFREQMTRIAEAGNDTERLKLIGDAQTMLARDCVNVFLFQLPQITISNADLRGLWKDSPIFANDMSSVSWR